MTTGSKTLKIDSKIITDSIIMDKCNSLEMKHEVEISDMTNWVVDRFDSHNDLKSVLVSKGYSKCLKRDAKWYATLTRKGSEFPLQSIWIN